MKTSIRNKFLLAFAFLVALSAACQILFNVFFAMDYYTNEKKDSMESAFNSIVNAYDGTSDSIALAIMPHETQDGINVFVYAADGSTIYTNRIESDANHFGLPNDRLSPSGQTNPSGQNNPGVQMPNISEQTNDISVLLLEGSFTYEEEIVYVTITLSLMSIENSVDILTRASMLISIFVLIISIFFSLFFAKSITRPIRAIEQISRKFAALDFSQKANENLSSIELSSLAVSLNSMSANLEQSINELNIANAQLQKDVDYHIQLEQMRREFTANVSHEMKTPLALLQLYANNLKSDLPDMDVDFYYDTIIEEADRLSQMVSSLLNISAVESGLSKMTMEPIAFSTFCTDVLAKLSPMLEPFETQNDIAPDLHVCGDKGYLEQAIKNYVTNATNHTQVGKAIRTSLTQQGNQAVFCVFNEGKHVAEADIPHLWESFYRSDKARTRTSHNVGLGLYIVKTILDNHGGQCAVENVDGGVCFSFSLPLDDTAH